MQYLGDITSGTTIRGSFNTRTAAGVPITLGGTPVLSVYKDAGTTETTTGVTLTLDFDSRTGHHVFSIVTSDAFYSTGSDYRVVITTGTVDGTSVVGTEVGSFSVQNRTSLVASAIRSAVGLASANLDTQLSGIPTAVWGAGSRTLTGFGTLVADVTTAVWAAGSRTLTAISDSSGITTLLTRIVGTLATGTHQPQTGDSFARLGAPVGSSISADVQTRLATASYTAPPAASVNAAAVRAELATELGRIDAAVSTRLASASYTSPPSSATIVAGVWSAASRTITGGTVTTVNDKTGYSLSQAFPANFAALGINASGHVSRVTLVDTTTTNSDMRGTNNALLAASYTAPANADVSAIKTVTDKLDTALILDGSVWQFTINALENAPTGGGGGGLDAAGVRAAIGLASANLDTQLADLPTVAEFNARSIPSADYFVVGDYTVPPTALANAAAVRTELTTELGRIDTAISTRSTFAGGAVASVTAPVTVGTNNDKTGYALSPAGVTAIESALINEGDGQQLINAIIGVINSNLDLPALELAAIASAVRTNLATELARIDVAISSRLASGSYTAPPTALANATAVRTELTTELARIDVAVSSRQAAGSAGTGARTVTVTVTLDATPLEDAKVRLTKGAETYIADTSVLGQAVFNVDDGTWAVSITAPNTSFAGATLVVDGNEAVTYAVTQTSFPVVVPSVPNTCIVTIRATRGGGETQVRVFITSQGATGRLNERAFVDRVIDSLTDTNGLLVVHLPWSSTPGVGKYRVQLLDVESGEVLHDRVCTVPNILVADYEDLT